MVPCFCALARSLIRTPAATPQLPSAQLHPQESSHPAALALRTCSHPNPSNPPPSSLHPTTPPPHHPHRVQVWAPVSALRDVKASVNWMYAAKMGSEGADMYDAAVALRDAMIDLEVAVDGGKDSLSMAASAGGGQEGGMGTGEGGSL